MKPFYFQGISIKVADSFFKYSQASHCIHYHYPHYAHCVVKQYFCTGLVPSSFHSPEGWFQTLFPLLRYPTIFLHSPFSFIALHFISTKRKQRIEKFQNLTSPYLTTYIICDCWFALWLIRQFKDTTLGIFSFSIELSIFLQMFILFQAVWKYTFR